MGLIKDGAKAIGICIGTIILIAIIFTAWTYIADFNTDHIENNTTITLNGVTITVPQTDNYTINNTDTLDYYDFMKSEYKELNLSKIDNWNKEGTAHSYNDNKHSLTIMVINSSDVPYIHEYDDGEVVDAFDDGTGRYFQQKKDTQ